MIALSIESEFHEKQMFLMDCELIKIEVQVNPTGSHKFNQCRYTQETV